MLIVFVVVAGERKLRKCTYISLRIGLVQGHPFTIPTPPRPPKKATLRWAYISLGIHLANVHLMGVNLMGGCFMGVHLMGVHLMGVNPTGVHPTGVHLTGVHPTVVHLMGVHLVGVYLTGVHLMGVYLMGVHLMGVSHLRVFLARRTRIPVSTPRMFKVSGLWATRPSGC
jgi:hypothetical protein